MSFQVLVLSDTHIPARTQQQPDAVIEAAESPPDLIVHAGDLVDEEVLRSLERFAPVQAVAGNMDPQELLQQLPRRREIDAGGIAIGVMHGDALSSPRSGSAEELVDEFPGMDVVITGHTHVPRLTFLNGVWIFNPGSPTDPRGGSECAFGWIEIDAGGIQFSLRVF